MKRNLRDDFGGAKKALRAFATIMLRGNYRARELSSVLEPSLDRVDACAIMKYLLGGRDAVNLRLRRSSYSSILFNLPRYREMHSIAISPGVEDSAHLRTLSSSPISIPFPSPSPSSFHPPPQRPFNVRSLVPASRPKKGLGRWKGAASS